MLTGTQHPTMDEEAYRAYIMALYDEIRTDRGLRITFRPLKRLHALRERSAIRMLVDIGYHREGDGDWVFQQAGFVSRLPKGFERLPTELFILRLASQGIIISNQRFILKERTNVALAIQNEVRVAPQSSGRISTKNGGDRMSASNIDPDATR